ncbi:MAG: 3-phosphoshikimate 1-carboxyvinyltransferase [Deltaproteobacteria bacterium]|nr:MAG: 3-phosphoshikimate 1-carboxyvinyltransferase [Deltaproteobacteria bacterium]
MKNIYPSDLKDNLEIFLPASKSYTHRVFIASALSSGECLIKAPLLSEDTIFTLEALQSMGVRIERMGSDVKIFGCGGNFIPSNEEINLGNSGTSMRLLSSVFALSDKNVILTGNKRMQERPLAPLAQALEKLGVRIEFLENTGCPPVKIYGGLKNGGETELDCRISSQYLSGLLLAAPLTDKGIKIDLTHEPVSIPYIDMTINIMKDYGVSVYNEGYRKFIVEGSCKYRHGIFNVEADCSNAAYFFAAAAVKKKRIKVREVSFSSSQGDIMFVKLLEKMGCCVKETYDGIVLEGANLSGIDADMKNMPDTAPVLAVVASFAQGKTRIRNVSHLRAKECDRIGCVVKELKKLGIEAFEKEDGMVIKGGLHKHAFINTYDDHRMAMSFAVAGIGSENGVVIENENCVSKSFPDFWEVFEGMLK